MGNVRSGSDGPIYPGNLRFVAGSVDVEDLSGAFTRTPSLNAARDVLSLPHQLNDGTTEVLQVQFVRPGSTPGGLQRAIGLSITAAVSEQIVSATPTTLSRVLQLPTFGSPRHIWVSQSAAEPDIETIFIGVDRGVNGVGLFDKQTVGPFNVWITTEPIKDIASGLRVYID